MHSTKQDRAASKHPSSIAARWQKKRHWHLLCPHRLLNNTFTGPGASIAIGITQHFACKLDHPGLAYLWHHRVAGRALLPGAAMLELALAAIKSLSGELTLSELHNHTDPSPSLAYLQLSFLHSFISCQGYQSQSL